MRLRKNRLAVSSASATLTLTIMLILTPTAQAQTYNVVHNFASADGTTPLAGVTIDSAGNLYGTTSAGGQFGFGNVYRMVHSGSSSGFSSIYSFRGETLYSLDGANPYSRVTIGPDGALYGTTHSGGNGQGCRELHGCGTVYRLQADLSGVWKDEMIFQFGYYDGYGPLFADVVFDPAGNLYGSTPYGGANLMGAVYKLSPGDGTWTESVVRSFSGADGSTPLNGPSMDLAGNLYGTASAGGANGFGTVYRLQPSGSGWAETVVHSFHGGQDGITPTSGIVLDQAGNLYGATQAAGTGGGGTAFELMPIGGGGWNISTLFGFRAPGFGGSYRTLARDCTGNLYGTTAADGAYQRGSIFKLTWSNGTWTYTSLHDFTGGADGGFPYGILSFDALDNIYGTASTGGAYGNGVVFEITP